MAQVNISVLTPEQEARVKRVQDTFSAIEKTAASIKNIFSSAMNFANTQISDPLKGIQNMVQQLSGVDLSKITSYSGILSEIASITKTIVDEQISWQQTLIGIYKQVAQTAKGSWGIYNAMAKTHMLGKDTLMQWNEWGGYAEGVRLATELASHSTNVISQLSSDLLLNWHKQNMALGISNEESAKMVGFMSRAGISIKEAVNFQGRLAASIDGAYNSQALTSKILTKITSSNFAIGLYQAKNLSYLSKIAIQAHEWNVEIDEIYQTSMKLGKAEEAIETARKFQLSFGIQLNARQMQYNAQTGKNLENYSMIVDSLKKQGIVWDNITLAQQQSIADTLTGGDLMKAKNVLLGKSLESTEAALSPQQQMTSSMENQNKLLTAMHDTMANWATYFIQIRASLWEPWMKNLNFIFGKNQEINSAQELSLAFEKERVRVLQALFLPMVERLNKFFGEGRSLLGENNSFISKMIPLFQAVGEKVAIIGETILNWIYKDDIFGKLASAVRKIDAKAIGEALITYGEAFVDFIVSLDAKKISDLIASLVSGLSIVWKIGKVLVDIFGGFPALILLAIPPVLSLAGAFLKAFINARAMQWVMKAPAAAGIGASAAAAGTSVAAAGTSAASGVLLDRFGKPLAKTVAGVASRGAGVASLGAGVASLGAGAAARSFGMLALKAIPYVGTLLTVATLAYGAYKLFKPSDEKKKISELKSEQEKTNSILAAKANATVRLDDLTIDALSNAIVSKIYMNKSEASRSKKVIPIVNIS